MPKISSTAVEAVRFEPRRQRLIVTFQGGARYAYAGVDKATYAALLEAESVGRFVNGEIKPRFPATRLTSRSGSAPRSAA
jgi:hypothetical protein